MVRPAIRQGTALRQSARCVATHVFTFAESLFAARRNVVVFMVLLGSVGREPRLERTECLSQSVDTGVVWRGRDAVDEW